MLPQVRCKNPGGILAGHRKFNLVEVCCQLWWGLRRCWIGSHLAWKLGRPVDNYWSLFVIGCQRAWRRHSCVSLVRSIILDLFLDAIFDLIQLLTKTQIQRLLWLRIIGPEHWRLDKRPIFRLFPILRRRNLIDACILSDAKGWFYASVGVVLDIFAAGSRLSNLLLEFLPRCPQCLVICSLQLYIFDSWVQTYWWLQGRIALGYCKCPWCINYHLLIAIYACVWVERMDARWILRAHFSS